jgi:hypothetical protein
MCPKCYLSLEPCDECAHRATLYPESRVVSRSTMCWESVRVMPGAGALYITVGDSVSVVG